MAAQFALVLVTVTSVVQAAPATAAGGTIQKLGTAVSCCHGMGRAMHLHHHVACSSGARRQRHRWRPCTLRPLSAVCACSHLPQGHAPATRNISHVANIWQPCGKLGKSLQRHHSVSAHAYTFNSLTTQSPTGQWPPAHDRHLACLRLTARALTCLFQVAHLHLTTTSQHHHHHLCVRTSSHWMSVTSPCMLHVRTFRWWRRRQWCGRDDCSASRVCGATTAASPDVRRVVCSIATLR
jgi:hypothetical protein